MGRAVAKNATIDYVLAGSTDTTQGPDLAAEYIVDNNLAPVLSDSFLACEAYLGNAEINSLLIFGAGGRARHYRRRGSGRRRIGRLR